MTLGTETGALNYSVKKLRAAALAVTLITLAGCNSGGTMDEAPSPFPQTPMFEDDVYQIDPVMDRSFASILNDLRLDNGAGPVTYNALLDQAAQGHADDMFVNDYFSHVDRNGNRVGTRVTATGYKWKSVGENLGRGYRNEAHVLEGWKNSPSHHAGQINPEYEEFGLGRAGSGRDARWVLVLADPK